MLNKLTDVVVLSQQFCKIPIRCHLKYATRENFLGRVVDGYHENAHDVGLLTKEAAHKLCEAQNYFAKQYELGIIIFDSLRPVRAVKDFTLWMKTPPHSDYELQRKKLHYPHLEKHTLAEKGYIMPNVSRHCFGNVVDMSLIRLKNGSEINMGAIFDYFDEVSHPTVGSEVIGKEAFSNRMLFIEGMKQFGFEVHPKEFWHFEYAKREVDEPFDFEINQEMKGLNV